MKPKFHPKRRNARRLAVQTLYQWQFTQAPIETILEEVFEREDFKKIQREYFVSSVQGTVERVGEIDAVFTPFLDRPITELNPVELAVLRLATFELLARVDIPHRVILNEALELAKEFGAIEGYKYVNAVLDKILPTIRSH